VYTIDIACFFFGTDGQSTVDLLPSASNTSKTLKMPRAPPVVLAAGHALKPVLWFPGDSVADMVDSDLEQVCDIARLGCTQPTRG
tara:strand:+ start:248 stop:502 length:255 start_codon:yes stop_codon:yes gene_type:complete